MMRIRLCKAALLCFWCCFTCCYCLAGVNGAVETAALHKTATATVATNAATSSSSSATALTATKTISLQKQTIRSRRHTNRHSQQRSLQQGAVTAATTDSSTFTHRVNYTAHYQLIRDTTCDGPSPVLRVSCRPPPTTTLGDIVLDNQNRIVVHATSDPSIVCGTTPQLEATTGWLYLECINTCVKTPNDTATTESSSSSSCRSVYLQVDSSIDLGPFGTIDFSCYGTDGIGDNDLDGAVELMDSGDGTCGDSASGLTRNLHILRMGVACWSRSAADDVSPPLLPFDDNQTSAQNVTTTPEAAASPISSNYVFDDYYFECTPSTASYPYGDNIYTCVVGASCNGIACTVNFEPLIITSQSSNLNNDYDDNEQCIESLITVADVPTGPSLTVPTASPTTASSGRGDSSIYTARFRASWGRLFDAQSGNSCDGSTIPAVQIECVDSNLQLFLQSSSTTAAASRLNCTAMTPNIATCSDSNRNNYVDRFTSVDYACTGPVVPQTTVAFVENAAYCNGNGLQATVTHALQLGIYCGIGSSSSGTESPEFLFSGDLFLDCAQVRSSFGYLDEMASTVVSNASRYTCSETATFVAGSNINATQRIPTFGIGTDQLWATSPDSTCYVVVPSSITSETTPPMPTSPLLPPSVAPIPLPFMPSSPSIEEPSPSTFGSANAAPLQQVPPRQPVMTGSTTIGNPTTVTDNVVTNSDPSFPIGIVAAVASAGVVVIVVTTFLAYWLTRRRNHPGPSSTPLTNTTDHPSSIAGGIKYASTTVVDSSTTGQDTSWNDSHAGGGGNGGGVGIQSDSQRENSLSDIWAADESRVRDNGNNVDRPHHTTQHGRARSDAAVGTSDRRRRSTTRTTSSPRRGSRADPTFESVRATI